MAITTTTITKNAGWARTDVIDQLEQAFTWLGLHGTQISGLVTSISSYNGGGTVGSATTTYYDIFAETTTGIGTGASFDVVRSSGVINAVYVNRPGYGYTSGEYVTIPASRIGNSASGIGITVNVEGGASPVGYGSTNQFFDKNLTPSDSNRPWAVLKQDFDTSKRFGVTYRGFKVYADNIISLFVGSSFFPYDTTNTSDRGGQRRDSFRGTLGLDISAAAASPGGAENSLDTSNSNGHAQVGALYGYQPKFASTNSPTSHDLKLNIYRSGIDPNFAVLSFNQPSISGTLDESTFLTFIIHNFNSNLWNLNQVFSAGVTFIDKDPSINTDGGNTGIIGFKTFLVGNNQTIDRQYASTRTAEAGWSQIRGQLSHTGLVQQNYFITSSQSNYINSTGDGMLADGDLAPGAYDPCYPTIYSRTGGSKDTGTMESTGNDYYGNRYPITTYNAVIKGIPINGNLIPCPYYMPDDFVVIDFKLSTSGQDIKQGDTVTISGGEVYTVITGSYNKSGETAGILFCARTV